MTATHGRPWDAFPTNGSRFVLRRPPGCIFCTTVDVLCSAALPAEVDANCVHFNAICIHAAVSASKLALHPHHRYHQHPIMLQSRHHHAQRLALEALTPSPHCLVGWLPACLLDCLLTWLVGWLVSVASWGRGPYLTAHGSRPQDHRLPTS